MQPVRHAYTHTYIHMCNTIHEYTTYSKCCQYKYFFVVFLFICVCETNNNHLVELCLTNSLLRIHHDKTIYLTKSFFYQNCTYCKSVAGLYEVIIYSSPDDKKKNRGFCFLEYESHKAASLAKRRLGTGRIKASTTTSFNCSSESNLCTCIKGLGMWYYSRLGRSTGGAGWTNNVKGESVVRSKFDSRRNRGKTEGENGNLLYR